jgi:hypothetical protein
MNGQTESLHLTRELIETLLRDAYHTDQIHINSGQLFVPDRRIELVCSVPAGRYARSDTVPTERYVRCALQGAYILTGALMQSGIEIVDSKSLLECAKHCAKTDLSYRSSRKLGEPFDLSVRLLSVRQNSGHYFGFFGVGGAAEGKIIIAVENKNGNRH